MHRIPRLDNDGILERGSHRASLRKLSKGALTHRECSDVMRQNYIDMALLDPPLVDVDGDEIRITEAGRRALPPDGVSSYASKEG